MKADTGKPGATAAEASHDKVRQQRPSGNAVTVRDVARMAGVSVATVSRVLNGNDKVAEELRDQVQRTADRMGYTPHAAARALASQRSTTIGAIVPTLEDPNFAVGIAALQKRATEAGYTLLLASSNYDKQEELRQVRTLTAHGIAGLMMVGAQHAPETYEILHAKRIPYVNTWVLDDRHPCVGFDNREIGRIVANYLLDLGHTEFGVIAQRSLESDRAAGRMAGIREALAARGVKPPQEQLIARSHKVMDGQIALRMLMSGARRPTAVVCGTDVLAFGALVEARSLGIDVPRQLSVTGINDIEFSAHTLPPLTTVRLPVEEIGERAADYLLASARGQQAARVAPVPFSLIVRGTTAPPQGSGASASRRRRKQ
ncbi:LacI family DNA-binding transcriptional regulator [Bordetella genomosp. 10]|nr:LacI family DNA-binding transcriptional regulator [Bordetella genomosp. 10]